MKGKVLLVDDEPNALKVLSSILSDEGYRTYYSPNVESAVRTIDNGGVDVVITDLRMPGRDGVQLFEYVNEKHPNIPVVFLTAYGTVDSAAELMRQGAYHYFIKPPDYEKLKGIISRAVAQRRLKGEIEYSRVKSSRGNGGRRIIGDTPGIKRVLYTVKVIRDSESSVFISGETGTGKELIARVLHDSSYRRDKPFVAVNSAAIPKDLAESEFFGYEKGAFTGAISMRKGKFEEASGGTLFLDEISELNLSLQAKLLRVLQEREVEKIGSNRRIKVDFRLISSTNRDLKNDVMSGRFREDLFYRINVVEIEVPSLRERKEDIPAFALEFVRAYCMREGKKLAVSEEVMNVFQRYHWPGNIRQLKNVIERAVVLARGDRITMRHLPAELLSLKKEHNSSLKTIKQMEMEAIQVALQTYGGKKKKAEKALGI